jgi:hypothetical protein
MVAVATLFGVNFYDLQPDTAAGARSLFGVVFFSIIYTGQINQVFALPLLFGERVVFYRERASKLYSAFAYKMAIFVVEIPYLLVSSFLFSGVFFLIVQALRVQVPLLLPAFFSSARFYLRVMNRGILFAIG